MPKKYIDKVILNGEEYLIAGGNGSSKGRPLKIYRISDTLPARPVGGSYDWATDTLIEPALWSRSLLTSEKSKVYVSDGIGYEDTTEVEWTTPYTIGEVVIEGGVEFDVARIRIYIKADTTPLTPSSTYGSYDFETRTFSDCPKGWTTDRAEAKANPLKYLYYSERLFQTNGRDDGWSTPLMDVDSDMIKETEIPKYGTAMVFRTSTSAPPKPEGNGEYDFDNNKIISAPVPWVTNVNLLTAENGEEIWFSIGSFTEGLDTVWTTPVIYYTKQAIVEGSSTKTKSYGVEIYKASNPNTESMLKPNNDLGVFDFTNLVLSSCPPTWYRTPAEASAAYTVANPNITTPKIWISFNTYSVDAPNGVIDESTASSTGWTDPVVYIDFEAILAKADANSKAAIEETYLNAINYINNKTADFDSKIQLLDGVTTTIDSISVLFTWELWDSSYNSADVVSVSANSQGELNANYTGSEYYNKIAIINGQAYKYYASSAEITREINSLKTIVNNNGEHIRVLELSEIILNQSLILLGVSEVTGIKDRINTIEGTLLELNKDSITALVVSLVNRNIETTMAQLLHDRITLSVTADSGAGADGLHGSTLIMYQDGVELTSTKICLNGDVIAKAIETRDLNINNTTYLNRYGDAMFAQGNGKNGSAIWANGTGYLAGGKIQWGPLNSKGEVTLGLNITISKDSEFGLAVKGHIEANSGSFGPWTIGLDKNRTPVILGQSSRTGALTVLTPTEFYSLTSDFTYWKFGGENAEIIIGNGALRGWIENNKYKFEVKGGIYASYGVLGDLSDSTKAWTIGTALGYGCLYTGDPSKNNDYMIISPECMEAKVNGKIAWSLCGNGRGSLGYGLISWVGLSSDSKASVNIAGWTFHETTAPNGTVGEILSVDGTLHLVSTGTIWAGTNSKNPWWTLNSDGSGSLGNSGITWNANGYNAKIAGWSINFDKLTATSNGNTLEISPSNGISLSNKWSLNTDGSAIFASGALKCLVDGKVVIDLRSSFTENGSTVPTATHLDGKGLAFYQGANASENTALPEYSIGIDGVLKKLSDNGYAQGLFYRIVESEDIAKSNSANNPGVLYAVPEEGGTVSGFPGYVISNRTGRR